MYQREKIRTRVRLWLTCLVAVAALSACGGSSSETPMPLEPVPHQETPPRKAAPPQRDTDRAEPSSADSPDEVGSPQN